MAVEHGRVEGAPDRCAMEKKQQTIRTAPWTPLCALVVRSHIYSPSLCYILYTCIWRELDVEVPSRKGFVHDLHAQSVRPLVVLHSP